MKFWAERWRQTQEASTSLDADSEAAQEVGDDDMEATGYYFHSCQTASAVRG